MTARKGVQTPDITASRGAQRPVARCELCGFVGEANDEQSPYIYCGDPHDRTAPPNPRRHQRSELAASAATA